MEAEKPYVISPICLQENDAVWLEVFDYGKGEYCVFPCVVKWIEPDGLCLLDEQEFGHFCGINEFNESRSRVLFGWRCWNTRPSPERMASVPWNRST